MEIITTEELRSLIENRKIFFLIDVRTKSELDYGMIPTAHHISLNELGDAFDLEENEFKNKYGFKKPTKNDLIVFYCKTGVRSSTAQQNLKSKGYNTRNYKGSVKEWSQIDTNVRMYWF